MIAGAGFFDKLRGRQVPSPFLPFLLGHAARALLPSGNARTEWASRRRSLSHKAVAGAQSKNQTKLKGKQICPSRLPGTLV